MRMLLATVSLCFTIIAGAAGAASPQIAPGVVAERSSPDDETSAHGGVACAAACAVCRAEGTPDACDACDACDRECDSVGCAAACAVCDSCGDSAACDACAQCRCD